MLALHNTQATQTDVGFGGEGLVLNITMQRDKGLPNVFSEYIYFKTLNPIYIYIYLHILFVIVYYVYLLVNALLTLYICGKRRLKVEFNADGKSAHRGYPSLRWLMRT